MARRKPVPPGDIAAQGGVALAENLYAATVEFDDASAMDAFSSEGGWLPRRAPSPNTS